TYSSVFKEVLTMISEESVYQSNNIINLLLHHSELMTRNIASLKAIPSLLKNKLVIILNNYYNYYCK
ncbi:MAG: hypothetical protein ACXAEU_18680, partial [Candidatus Hodarchaeales archaeon]